MQRVVEPTAPCKCCAAAAPLLGVVDFHKHCDEGRTGRFSLLGIPIYYYRCPSCGFLFTTAYDSFSPADFARHIYNADYHRVDPDFADARPRANANMLIRLLGGSHDLAILDYGGGNGRLEHLLREAGFTCVTTYDPFVPAQAARPQRQFDLIVSFEVVEHSTDPLGTFRDMAGFLNDGGLILFSTLLQPANIQAQGVGWWYVGPRNGHVSLHTAASLAQLGKQLGLRLHSLNEGLHTFCRQVPPFAKHFVPS